MINIKIPTESHKYVLRLFTRARQGGHIYVMHIRNRLTSLEYAWSRHLHWLRKADPK